MKKLLAMVSALLMISSGSLNASAIGSYYPKPENFYESMHNEYDMLWDLSSRGSLVDCYFDSVSLQRRSQFLVVTTEDGLPADAMETDFYVSYITELENFIEPENIIFNGGNYLNEKYGENIKLYYATSDKGGSYDWISGVSEKFLLNYDSVLGIELLQYETQGQCMWDGTYSIGYNAETISEPMNPEVDEMIESNEAFYQEWKTKYDQWEAEHEGENLTNFDKLDSLRDAGLMTVYEMAQFSLNSSQKIKEASDGKIAFMTPNLEFIYSFDIYSPFSLWDGVGDMNSDGDINTTDASNILAAIARIGAGGSSGLTEAKEDRADLNLDGKIDARDAAIVLAYAAQRGAGINVSLEKFLMQNGII